MMVSYYNLVPGRYYIIKEHKNERTLCLCFQKIFEYNGTYASFRSEHQAPNSLATGFDVQDHTFFDYDELLNPIIPDVTKHIQTFLHR